MSGRIYWKILCLSVLMALTSGVVSAETVSQREALNHAVRFFDKMKGKSGVGLKMVYNGRKLTTSRLFPPFYIYNHPAGGFVIISAENKAFPILAYSLTENFDPDRLDNVQKSILAGYARDIELIRYDSRVPLEAIAAWRDFDGYVESQLASPVHLTNHLPVYGSARSDLDKAMTEDSDGRLSSDIYTPAQWQTLISSDLDMMRNVVVGFASRDEVIPVILTGHKGDFFMISFDGSRNPMMRLMATEFLSDGQYAVVSNAPARDVLTEEDTSFGFYDSFIDLTEKERHDRSRMFDLRLEPENPVVRVVGGGHFEIKLPENVSIARIYNLSGGLVSLRTYGSTELAAVNIEAEPSGFYIIQLIGESGKPYGLKIYR